MTPDNLASRPATSRSSHGSGRARRGRRRLATPSARRPYGHACPRATVARFTDWRGRAREIILRAGCAGSMLVIDRDATTLGDRRLVAHLAADEPRENARVVSRCYLAQARRGRCRCRRLHPDDLRAIPFAAEPDDERAFVSEADMQALNMEGHRVELTRLPTGMSIPELRWCLRPADSVSEDKPVSVREAIARLESYEPVRTLTSRALELHERDEAVSTTVLRAELARVQESPIVLNRGLREAVLLAVERQGLSMSEIAIRCGRVKRDCAGNESGETSWLSRRIGLLPEGGRETPTPWIHTDVLALIARDGLGTSPREVELG